MNTWDTIEPNTTILDHIHQAVKEELGLRTTITTIGSTTTQAWSLDQGIIFSPNKYFYCSAPPHQHLAPSTGLPVNSTIMGNTTTTAWSLNQGIIIDFDKVLLPAGTITTMVELAGLPLCHWTNYKLAHDRQRFPHYNNLDTPLHGEQLQ